MRSRVFRSLRLFRVFRDLPQNHVKHKFALDKPKTVTIIVTEKWQIYPDSGIPNDDE